MTRLTKLSLANRTVVLLVCAILIGLGLFATSSLKQELIPSIETPAATIVSVLPGAAPEVVEREVSRPIEDAAKAVSGITRVTSRSASAVSTVRVEWEFGTGSDKVLADLRSAVDGIQGRLPSDVTPQVVAGRFDDVPIIVLAVSSTESKAILSGKLKDIVAAKLKTLPGVRDVVVSGQEQEQVVVTLRPADVDRLGVDTSTLAQVFAASGIAVPAGSIPSAGTTMDVEVGKTLTSTEAIAAIQLQGTDGPLALKDIADVTMAPVETTSISRANGKPSLTVAVTKEQSGNTVAVSQAVRAELPALMARVGGGATDSIVFDQAPYIEDSVHDLTVEGLLGLFSVSYTHLRAHETVLDLVCRVVTFRSRARSPAAHEPRREDGHHGEGDEQRCQQRDGDGHGERPEQLAGLARHQPDREEDGDRRQGRGRDGPCDLADRADDRRGAEFAKPLMPFDVLDDDD